MKKYITFLKENPYKFGHMLGFTKLTPLHNEWIKNMLMGKEDASLEAHRGSYKTTCVSIALALIMILRPNIRTLFMRKTDTDVKEVIKQVKNILLHPATRYFVQKIYGVDLKLATATQTEISTNLTTDIKGTAQLVGIGTSASLTGKHFDRIFTDDIINISDRISRAERERTKTVYQELQNIKNRGTGRIFNTLTPWHKDDASTLMPSPIMYDCYSTGLMTDEEIEEIKSRMSPSLFAANYELKHIASEEILFDNPQTGADFSNVLNGTAHVDAAYYGEDYTAFTVAAVHDGKFYVFGKCWRSHVDNCLTEIVNYKRKALAGKIHCELNADKGATAKELRQLGETVVTYTESMNKHLKIMSHLKFNWSDVIFVEGTDEEYISQICDYNENAEHDDCPDSLASLIRILKKNPVNYSPIW